MRKKLVLDQCYVRTGNFWLDLRIMLGTMVYLVGFPYNTVRKVMRLPDPLAGQEAEPRARAATGPFQAALGAGEPVRPLAVGEAR